MSLTLYTGTTSPGTPITLYQVEKNYAYIRFDNNTPNHLSINMAGKVVDVGEFYSQDVEISVGFQGTIIVTPSAVITSTSHSQANLLVIKGQYAQEVNNPVSQAIPQQAVNITATGKPIYSATAAYGNTAALAQALNIFNPANSGVVMFLNSAIISTNDTTVPSGFIGFALGADINLSTTVTIESHAIVSGASVSVGHATTSDGGSWPSTLLDQHPILANTPTEFIRFPDEYRLYPGGNFTLSNHATVTGKIVSLTLIWTEDIIVPPIQITGATAVATQVDNSILSPLASVGTNLIKSTVPGPLTPVQLFNDGTGFWSVDQSGTLHRVFTFNSAGDALGLGQLGDATDLLGTMLLQGGLSLSGKHPAQLAGGTSGTADLYELFTGGIKVVLVVTNNFKTAAGAQSIVLPTAFIDIVFINGFDLEPVQFMKAGVSQANRQVSAFSNVAGSPNTTIAGSTTGIQFHNIIWFATGFDTLQFNGGWGSAHTGVLLIVGH